MKIFHLFILICGLVGGIVWPDSASAQRPYAPELPIAVKTEFIENHTYPPAEFSSTMIRVLEKNETGLKIGFFPSDRVDAAAGILNLGFSGEISWSGVGQAAPAFKAKNLFILSGVTLPVDVLPIQMTINADAPLGYEFSQNAGERTFSHRIQVATTPVSLADARQAGWILCEDCPVDADDLQMIVATDLQTGELVVKQLWAADSSWWLYEETPFRRSWRFQ